MKPTVLIVDDSKDLQNLLQLALSNEGYHSICASNGIEALQILRKAQSLPFLILLDYLMPQMNGLEFLSACRADIHLRSIPIAMCSASKIQTPHGIEFLKKPFELEALLNLVTRYHSAPPILSQPPATHYGAF